MGVYLRQFFRVQSRRTHWWARCSPTRQASAIPVFTSICRVERVLLRTDDTDLPLYYSNMTSIWYVELIIQLCHLYIFTVVFPLNYLLYLECTKIYQVRRSRRRRLDQQMVMLLHRHVNQLPQSSAVQPSKKHDRLHLTLRWCLSNPPGKLLKQRLMVLLGWRRHAGHAELSLLLKFLEILHMFLEHPAVNLWQNHPRQHESILEIGIRSHWAW